MADEGPALTPAQQRAAKRTAKIRQTAGDRINKITVNTRGQDGADYLKTDTPFERPSPNAAADPDDVDLSITPPPTNLFSLTPDSANSTQLPPELADNPLLAALMGNMPMPSPGQQAQPLAAPLNKSTLERLMPLVHVLSMLAIVVWTVWNSTFLEWSSLAYRKNDGFATQAAESLGIYSNLPLFYIFITVELGLQSIHITLARRSVQAPGLLNSILPMLPHPFGMYAQTALRYYTMFGQVLDDLSILIAGIGLIILYHAWPASI